MLSTLDRPKIKKHLENFDLQSLFVEELGWDYGGSDTEIVISGCSYALKAVAHKRGMVAYQYLSNSPEVFPDHPTRQKIERVVAKTVREHVIVYATHDKDAQYWQWVKREPGRPDRSRLHMYHRDQTGEALIQKLEHLVFTLDEEDDLTIVDVSGRVRAAFDVERVTRRFYDRFKKEHSAFLNFIDGIEAPTDREWYASLMLNRMMFIYFIQKRGFLDDDLNYLRNRLVRIQSEHGKDQFQTFYRLFLLRLFHEGLSLPATERAPALSKLLGEIPYLDGGLFEVHDLERDNQHIQIPDKAFRRIFDFFDSYQWHLDDRPLRDDKEINPDVLGYIFEKYINQKQMGAYYTKEDITGYISRNTVIPFLFDQAQKDCPIALEPGSRVWRLLSDDPDRYVHDSVRHGITYDINLKQNLAEWRELPPNIAVGIENFSRRSEWSNAAPPQYALPTETWRQHIARRQRYKEVRARIAAGMITSINDLITYDLNIEKFTHDVIRSSEEPELIRAFWKSINTVSILDPTCGSGAFLFAALNILEPIYVTCLEAMRSFLDDLERTKYSPDPDILEDFHQTLDRIAEHSSERYFILKSIVVSNLYGVDIMEEAVEICKLRLFLKLVAQLESYSQIEPLPDIDFNIRSGNTLIGFTSLEEIKQALSADIINQLSLPLIEERAEMADIAFRKFREIQTVKEIEAQTFANAKSELRKKLDKLRNELDGYIAKEFGVRSSNQAIFQRWHKCHRPFHWLVEFYGVMRYGGFDVVIGNPPYVPINKISYQINSSTDEKFPDIYGNILLRSLALTKRNGRSGMIIPLSITFSREFEVLRDKMRNWGSGWFSSYDNIPAALFVGVSQRCTIWIGQHSNQDTFVAPMYRWRVSYRLFLLENLNYVLVNDYNLAQLGLPKLSSYSDAAILRIISPPKQRRYRKILAGRRGRLTQLRFSQAARNFISVFLKDPPCLDAVNLSRVAPSKIGRLSLTNKSDAYAALAATAGELYFWYWLVRGDGFDVTNWVVSDFLEFLDSLPDDHYNHLVELGQVLDTNRNKWLVFKKNAGRFVGNFNFRGAFEITRRADLLILSTVTTNRDEALSIFDYVQRVLSINEYAGEKGIPEAVKEMFKVETFELNRNRNLFSDVDSLLMKEFGFDERGLTLFVEKEIDSGFQYRPDQLR